MRLLNVFLYSFLLLIGIIHVTSVVYAVESPRMIINSDAPDIDSLLLESTVINAKISGIIADITIQQKYVYKGSSILDGALLMPGDPSITIHGCTVKIGNQTIKAEMKDREKVREIFDGKQKDYEITPEDFGFKRDSIDTLRGGLPAENAAIIRDYLAGKQGPIRDALLLNSGLTIAAYNGKHEKDIHEQIKVGIESATDAIDSGSALNLLNDWGS